MFRTIYLSNAERYFPHTPDSRRGLLAMPTDDRALVLRTRARMSWSLRVHHPGCGNFKRWLDWGKMSYAVELTRYRGSTTPPAPASSVASRRDSGR